jgi:hypothetical protein
MRIHFQEPNAQINNSAPPFKVCRSVRANQNVGGGFIVFFASRTLAVVPETANLQHSSNTAKSAHVFRSPNPEHFREALSCQFYCLPVNEIKASCRHSKVVQMRQLILHGVLVNSLQKWF